LRARSGIVLRVGDADIGVAEIVALEQQWFVEIDGKGRA
jgi:hypothetical protein